MQVLLRRGVIFNVLRPSGHIRTTCFDVPKETLHSGYRVHLCVSYGSHNKQRVLYFFNQIRSKRKFAKYCVIPYTNISGIVKPISATNKTCVTNTRRRLAQSLNALINTEQTPSTLKNSTVQNITQDGCHSRVRRFIRVRSSSGRTSDAILLSSAPV
jgi:hypothetical protein